MANGSRKPDHQNGQKLGGFELLGRLGKGGMGTVLKARQVSMDRLVALKILPKRLAENEQFVQRFLREARSAAKLRHPNIVQGYDVGFVDGYYFFAMEFVDGETLADIVRRDGPLEPDRALHVMKEIASALAAAHEEGIVHRDIKPANIMLDERGEVRVTDFGLAKHTEGDVEVTADGTVVGTPAYVAPEMAKGGEADHRSDLYSLAATIFCALAGRPPFEGKNFSEVLIKQANEPAPPLATLAPRVDRRLCHIIDRLLRKNPEARYPTAKVLLEDLNGLGKLQSVGAAARAEAHAMLREAPTLEMTESKRLEREARLDVQRPKSKRTTLIAVSAVVGILAIAGLVLALRSGHKPPGQATVVKPPTSPPLVPSTAVPVPPPPVPPPKPPVETAPRLLAPEPGALMDNGSEDRRDGIAWDFSWSAVPGAERYHLHVIGPGAPIPAIDKVLYETRYEHRARASCIVERFQKGWRWKVRANVRGAWSEWSQERTFDVEPVGPARPKAQPAPPGLATVSFTAPSDSKGLMAISEGDGKFTTAEREGKPVLQLDLEGNNPNHEYRLCYFRARDDFAKLFQADTGRTALVTVTLFDPAPGDIGIQYDSHPHDPGEQQERAIWRGAAGHRLRGTGQWTQVKLELPGARFGHRQNYGADFRLGRRVPDFPLLVHSVTVSAIEEERPPNVPPQVEQGLVVAFYAGQNHERFVVAQRASRANLSWDRRAPAPDVPEDGFSTRIVGWVYIPDAGDYTFWLFHDDGGRLYLDGRKLIDDWAPQRGDSDVVSVQLRAGWHRLWLEHMDTMGEADIAFYWRRGDREGLVPHTLLYCEREMLERIRRDPTEDPFVGLTPDTPVKAPDQPVEAPAEPRKEDIALAAAAAAYAKESGKLWALFKKRDYAEADKLLPNLPKVPSLQEVTEADREAAKLLREFWAAVERGVAARKGKFVSVAGRGGNVVKAEAGNVTLKAGARELTVPLVGMDAAQAAAIADLKDDERGNLAKAVFLIAEGDDANADAAGKALAAVPDGPSVAIYRGRLSRMTAAVAAAAAATADASFKRALALAEAMLNAGKHTEARQALARAANLKPDDPAPRRILDDAFAKLAGQVVAAGEALDFAKARRLLDAAEELEPNHPDVKALGGWLKASGKPLFADDFSGGRGRWGEEEGNWRVTDGALATVSGEKSVTFIKGLRIDDFVLQFDMKNLGETGGFRSGVVFRDAPGRSLYLIPSVRHNELHVGGLTDTFGSTAESAPGVSHRYVRGNWNYPFKEGVTYHIAVRCVGKELEYSINGEPVVTGTDEKPGRGRIGFFARAADARFDNVVVYRVVLPPEKWRAQGVR